MDSLVVERWKKDLDLFQKAATELGAKIEIKIAGEDPELQSKQIRELSDLGIDVLVVIPNDASRLSQVVRDVKAQGIKVLSYDRLVKNAGVDLYVSFDNEKVGTLMAESLVKAAPAGNYVIVNGPKSDNNAMLLNTGIHKALEPKIANGRIKIIAEIWPESWSRDEVYKTFEKTIFKNNDLAAIIAGNDMLAEAIIAILSEYRLAGLVKVAGQDADLAACQRIAEGSQHATIYKPIDRLALAAAGFAVMLAKGEAIPSDTTIFDGKQNVPFIRLEPILVTKDLLDATVIADQFHSAKDVYRNIKK